MKYIIIMLMLFSTNIYSQDSEKDSRKRQAKVELDLSLLDKSQHNVIDNKSIIIKDSLTAIKIVEPILFGVYGKEKIESEKPYEAFLINNYWVISGTLPKDSLGGTFLIIMDARNSQILRMTHSK